MKSKLFLPLMILGLCFCFNVQSQINISEFETFKQQSQNLDLEGLNSMYARPAEAYYKGYNETPDFENVLYLDSVKRKYTLTSDELKLLKTNHFFVTERLSYESFNAALTDIFNKDLPVFISTDAVLHLLHLAYDRILKELEMDLMSVNLENYLKELYDRVPSIAARYQNSEIDESLADLDLYVSVAYSLITERNHPVRIASEAHYNAVMAAITEEKATDISLFCSSERFRTIDFSQFKVRGHYVYQSEDSKSLEPYFRTMMWLGRMDFYLTPPQTTDAPWTKDEIRRMNISSFLLNEIHQSSAQKEAFGVNEKIINYLVGESDNITIDEFNNYLISRGITKADDLLNNAVYDPYSEGLSENENFLQKIMGAIYLVDPRASRPSTLPVSFLMSGQRFIIDSEVLSNVVFDRIIYNEQSQLRWMPDPLDALFALGNNDAAYFLEEELNTYHYAANLANMRYLIDNKEDDFWNASLYNSWLNAIRKLNPEEEETEQHPFFMRTSAWHQQKMNTQLASWTQLRHDNLLYAKPSYTGAAGCSYPYSFVEPYPEFYKTISNFCRNADSFFAGLPTKNYYAGKAKEFFPKFASVMDKLAILAEKEVRNEPFSTSETDWLKTMLSLVPDCTPRYTGWLIDLILDDADFEKPDYITVDLHTQPTDSSLSMVGRVLHTGVGKINLGTFLIKPSGSNEYVAFTGPFMSYYEKITSNFQRMTDQDWALLVENNTLPNRPEWTLSYLANSNGLAYSDAKGLPVQFLVSNKEYTSLKKAQLIRFYPNPVSDELTIEKIDKTRILNYSIFNSMGEKLFSGVIPNKHTIDFSVYPKGLYLLNVESEDKQSTVKFLKK